jgi:hypothetical protein
MTPSRLTIHNASSTDYTLKIMTIAALVFTPIVLALPSWTYWIFRKRISTAHIPPAQDPDPPAGPRESLTSLKSVRPRSSSAHRPRGPPPAGGPWGRSALRKGAPTIATAFALTGCRGRDRAFRRFPAAHARSPGWSCSSSPAGSSPTIGVCRGSRRRGCLDRLASAACWLPGPGPRPVRHSDPRRNA